MEEDIQNIEGDTGTNGDDYGIQARETNEL